MLNVNQITSYLAKLQPDSALQKYAQMHKDDPYIMALAMSEFNRRKQTRQGAQINAPEQPKVVDQAIQSMGAPMPEDVGIGQLPAGNMNFADGGIVAFSDGGDVPKLTRSDALKKFISRAAVPAAVADVAFIPVGIAAGLNSAMDYTRGMGMPVDPMGEFSTGAATPEQAEFDEARRRRLITEMSREERLRKFGTTDVNVAMQGGAFSSAGQAAAAAANQAATRPGPSAAEVQMAMNAGAFKPAASAAPGPGPGTGAPSNRPPAPGAGQPPRASAGAQDPLIAQLLQPVQARPINFEPSQATMPTLEGIQNMFAASRPKPEDVVDPYAAQREELTNLATFQNAQEQAALEKQIKERGVLGEKQEARLKAREEKLGKQEKDLGPLAMIQAGFAIMGGQSRSALQNIGLGAQEGLKGYKAGLEKLEASRERIEEGLERIETARRSEGILNDQQRSALRREGHAIVRDGKKEGINALTAELGVQRGEANALFNAGINTLVKKGEIGSAERTAAAQMQRAAEGEAQQQAGANVREAAKLTTQRDIARMEAAAKSADVAVRREELRALAADKSVETMRKVWAESKVLQSQYPNINDWLTIVGKGAAGSGTKTDYSKWGTPAKVGP